ncbi:OmpA family protein [Flavobacterium defluvii]|nr:OmpA family protein [Flavobacterium defluvii]
MSETRANTEKVTPAAVKSDNFVPFVLNGSEFEFKTNENFKFLKNNAAIIQPISDSISIGIEKLNTFLVSNPKQKIIITGYAASEEKNTTQFENLGLARANEVKNFFVAKGLAASQFEVKGEIVSSWKTISDTLIGLVEYKFEILHAVSTANGDWSVLKDKINTNPLILHFNTNKSNFNLNNEEDQKLSDIIKYLENIKNASVLIVGHSDNVGNREMNIALAQKRAEFSKSYLIKNGIGAARIDIESKGPDEPVGDNATTEGRASNRRTVITIK